MMLWALLLGCDGPPPSGTLVGNPGKAEGRLAPAGGYEVVEADTALTVEFVGCGDGLVTVVDDESSDLVGGVPFDVPSDVWCGLVVTLEEPLRFVAERIDPPGELVVELEWPTPVTSWAEQPFGVDGDDLVLEIGSPEWLPDEFPLEEREEFGPDGEVARLLAADLAAGTSLYADDGDGVIDATERAVGPLAAAAFPPPDALATESEPEPLSIEGGCRTTPAGPGWLGLLALVGLTTRRGWRSRGRVRSR